MQKYSHAAADTSNAQKEPSLIAKRHPLRSLSIMSKRMKASHQKMTNTFHSLTLSAQNANTTVHISGSSKHAQETRAKPNSSNAKNATTPGANTTNTRTIRQYDYTINKNTSSAGASQDPPAKNQNPQRRRRRHTHRLTRTP